MSEPSDTNDPGRFQAELDLIAAIEAGSTEHWQRFVERFSGLIYSVIRRQLFAEDEDDVRTVFVDVLHDLYRGKLSEYKGRAELSTWLIVVVRGKALDFLRARDGRRALPAAYPEFTPFQQEVFRLYHAEGLPLEVVIDALERGGHDASPQEVAEAVLDIEARVDRHYLRRLENNARAKSMGVVSGRILEFLAEAHRLQREGDETRPDRALARKEAEEKMARVRELVEQLPAEEQTVLRLRYEENWTARRISEELELGSQRRVYTILDRALRRLRNLFTDNE
jgi:DNA-directed RNA polymerase specialized sigma24 family protein